MSLVGLPTVDDIVLVTVVEGGSSWKIACMLILMEKKRVCLFERGKVLGTALNRPKRIKK